MSKYVKLKPFIQKNWPVSKDADKDECSNVRMFECFLQTGNVTLIEKKEKVSSAKFSFES